jgi:hypothetical protein
VPVDGVGHASQAIGHISDRLPSSTTLEPQRFPIFQATVMACIAVIKVATVDSVQSLSISEVVISHGFCS